MNSSAEMAKASVSCWAIKKVVMPIRRPWVSNNPPPDDPGEIAADVCTSLRPSRRRKPLIKPSASVRAKPDGFPIV